MFVNTQIRCLFFLRLLKYLMLVLVVEEGVDRFTK